MSRTAYDIVVIGGGVNGLTCAAYLAQRGRRVLVLEALDDAGGGARTEEIVSGFRVPTLAHSAGPLQRDVVRDLALGTHGLELLTSEVAVTSLGASRPVVVYDDVRRTAGRLAEQSPRDGEAWPRFVHSLSALARVIASLYRATPPSIDEPGGRDAWSLLGTLRAFRALDHADAYRLLRWGPMAVADLVGECFTDEGLRAAVAADGIMGTRFGPWSAGSGMVLLLRAANEHLGMRGGWFARGGPGAIASALAAAVRSAGGEVRTAARVERVLVRDERAYGALLADGSEILASAVVSALDPQRTFLRLCDPLDLEPEFLWRLRNYRMEGTLAKVNLALSALPVFTGVEPHELRGRVRVAPSVDYLERAYDHSKYGRHSPEPYIELTLPSLLDPSLAPPGAHVLSAYVQFAPYRLRDSTWDAERQRLADNTRATLERYAPGLRSLVVAEQVITPLDLERDYGLTGGHIFHGELALDQMYAMRPLLGWAHYRSPIAGLYLCGSGTHPGTGLTGGSGANAAREILRARGTKN